MKTLITSMRLFLVLTVLTGFIYPLAVTLVAKVSFPQQTGGSLVQRDGKVVGSALLAQKFSEARYFHPRPSADDFNTVPSAASNLGPTSRKLKEDVAARAAALRKANDLASNAILPPDMLTASGSGLDPHISPAGARLQLDRVARARGFDAEQRRKLQDLVTKHTEPPQFGLLGEPCVNVLLLNLALDEI